MAVHKGLPTGYSFPYIPCDPYIPIRSGDVIQCHFWPIKAWDSWPSPLVLKVGTIKKVPIPP